MQQQAGSRPSTSGSDYAPSTPSHSQPAQVGSLTSAANRHLGKLHKAPSSPYQRLMTPDDHKALRAHVVSHLKEMASSFREAQAAGPSRLATPASPNSPPSRGNLSQPTSPQASRRHTSPLAQQRPSTALTVSELQMPRPGSRARRVSTPSLSSALSGATASWPSPSDPQQSSSAGALSPRGAQPPSRLGTPSRMVSASPGLLPRSPLAQPLTPTRLSGTGWNSNGGTGNGGEGPNRFNLPLGASRCNTSDSVRPQWNGSLLGSPRVALGTTAANVTGALEDFLPTRGMVYSVFSELDGDDCGKLTYSAFEEAAFVVGMRAEHARRFFDVLDSTGRGYITVTEWGAREKAAQVLNFTRLYVQQTRGTTGKSKDAREISTLGMAVEIAMHRLSLKNNGRSISQNRLGDAFRFIDTDSSGCLDRHEIADAFSALGIMVNPAVVDSAMHAFDKDGSGAVDYNEFLRTLFPTLSKGAYNMHG